MRVPAFNPLGPLAALKTWIESVTSILNGGATLADQMRGEIKTIEYDGSNPIRISTSLRTKPLAVLVLSVVRAGVSEVRSGLSVDWTVTTQPNDPTQMLTVGNIDIGNPCFVTLWIVGG